MRFLFSARPAFGHVYPLMPLALAARAAGHDVQFATTGRFVDTLAGLGLPTHDVGLTIEAARDAMLAAVDGDGMPKGGDGRPDLAVGAKLFMDVLAPATAADLAPVLDRLDPDVVVYEQFEFGAAVAAHAAGIPAIAHALSPRNSTEAIRPFAGEALGRLWAAHGLSSPALDVFTGDVYLDIIPDVLQVPSFRTDLARVSLRPIPYTEPGATAPAWLATRARPLVYLTLGTVVATDDALVPAIHGLASLDVDVLVALGAAGGQELGTVPSNVEVQPFVDQAAALRHAALAVHHGGSGTILAALAAGVPQLLLPKGADQFVNADVLAAAGIASVLEPNAATAGAVAATAQTSLGRLSAAARAAQAELEQMPTPGDVVDLLAARFSRDDRSAAA